MQGLLPGLAKQLNFRSLEYTSIQNQVRRPGLALGLRARGCALPRHVREVRCALMRVATCALMQGDWLVEVPVEHERRVPKDWMRVCGTKKARAREGAHGEGFGGRDESGACPGRDWMRVCVCAVCMTGRVCGTKWASASKAW